MNFLLGQLQTIVPVTNRLPADELGKMVAAKQMAEYRRIEAMNAQPPRANRLPNKAELVRHFSDSMKSLPAKIAKLNNTDGLFWHYMITGERHYSKKALAELEPILLAKMQLPMIHFGHFLACRLLTKPIVLFGMEMLVEDLDGNAAFGAMYNCLDVNDNANWLVPGICLLIKEPNLAFLTTDKFFAIRVDSPTDVIWVHETDEAMLKSIGASQWFKPEQMSVDELRQRGNELFKQGEYQAAIIFYQRALRKCGFSHAGAKILHLNLSMVMLKLNRFQEALDEVKLAMEKGEGDKSFDKEKALFRMGKALYGLGRWQEALDKFESISTSNAAFVAVEVDKTKKRLKESQTGDYDFCAIYEKAKNGCKFIDVADYTGPVRVVDIKGKGRGLIVTENVAKGTLLLGCKAFALAENCGDGVKLAGTNFISKELNKASQIGCITQTIRKLANNPQMAKDVFALYAGKDFDNEFDQKDATAFSLDTGRVERICSLNWFEPVYFWGPKIDRELWDGIDGLWLLPSFINHSCIANASRIFYGDLMLICARVDLQKGDELTLPYCNLDCSYNERKKLLFGKWQFECRCKICTMDMNNPDGEKERAALMENFEKDLYPKAISDLEQNAPKKSLQAMTELVAKIDASYGLQKQYKWCLLNPLKTLGALHLHMGKKEKAIEYFMQYLDIETQCDGPICFYYYLRVAQIISNELSVPNLKMAKKVAKKAYKRAQTQWAVPNQEFFLQINPEFAEFLK